MSERNDKNIYTYYSEYKDLIDCVYPIAPPSVKKIYTKKWGPYLRGGIYQKLTAEEERLFEEANKWFETTLSNAEKLKNGGYSTKDIARILKNNAIDDRIKSSTSIKLYPKLNQFLKEYNITREELDIILEDLPKMTIANFWNFYNRDIGAVEVAKTREAVLAEMQIVYAAVEKYNVQKSLEGKAEKMEAPVKKCNGIDGILKEYKLTQEELDQVVFELPREAKISFIYTYGMDGRSIFNTHKIAKMLNCSDKDVLSYLNYAYRAIASFAKKKEQPKSINGKSKQQKLAKKINVIPVRIYNGLDEILKNFELTMKEYEEIVEKWSFEQQMSFRYVNGIGRTKMSIDQTAKMLNCNNHQIRKHLKDSIDMLEEYKQQKKQDELKNTKYEIKKKSILERCKVEERKYLLKVIEYWKDNNPKYYDVIVKLCGPNYGGWNEEAYQKLSEEEKKTWKCITGNISRAVKNEKRREERDIKRKPKTTKKKSILERCKIEDRKYLLKRIEYWKNNNPKYYDVIVKLCGLNYDEWNEEAYQQLSEEESKAWKCITSSISQAVKNEKRREETSTKRKQKTSKKKSILEWCRIEEKKYLLKVIEYWKDNNPKYHDVIIKLCGPNYDEWNEETYQQLSEEESRALECIKNSISRAVENEKRREERGIEKKPKTTKKKSILEWCRIEERKYLLKVLEYWKDNNPKIHNVIVKLCGLNYDGWNEEAYQQLSEEESQAWRCIICNISRAVENEKRREETNIENFQNENVSFQTKNEPADSNTLESLILYEKASHMDTSDDILCKSLGITMEQLDDCYSKYLHLFGNQIPNIIEKMITRNANNVDKILTKSYLKDYLQYLTIEEQIYLYLKLQSYANNEMTDNKIAHYMGLAAKDIKDYKIMTSYEELNILNQLFKPKSKKYKYLD